MMQYDRKAIDELANKLCDRLCLNHDLFEEFERDPDGFVAKHVGSHERADVAQVIRRKLSRTKLDNHWQNAIACACRDVAYQIPD
jgi:hypothetical protein